MAQKEKLSITLNEQVARQVRERAGEGHVSEWMNDAALLRLQSERLDEHMRALGVTLSLEDLAEVYKEWPAD